MTHRAHCSPVRGHCPFQPAVGHVPSHAASAAGDKTLCLCWEHWCQEGKGERMRGERGRFFLRQPRARKAALGENRGGPGLRIVFLEE